LIQINLEGEIWRRDAQSVAKAIHSLERAVPTACLNHKRPELRQRTRIELPLQTMLI
jgi:hypothetical protein